MRSQTVIHGRILNTKDDPEAGARTPEVPQGLALDPSDETRRGLPRMIARGVA